MCTVLRFFKLLFVFFRDLIRPIVSLLTQTLFCFFHVDSILFPGNIQSNVKNPSLDRSKERTCLNCGLIVKNSNLSRHKKSCTRGTKSCLKCPNFYCKTQSEMNQHLKTKHAVSVLEAKMKCVTCEKTFSSFFSLQKHKKSEHGKPS